MPTDKQQCQGISAPNLKIADSTGICGCSQNTPFDSKNRAF